MKRVVFAVVLIGIPSLGFAQDPSLEGSAAERTGTFDEAVAEVVRGLSEGDFTSANAALDGAFGRAELSREELERLLELRALLAYAEDRLGTLEESLVGLATLRPSEPAPSDFPPPLRARYDEVRAQHPQLTLRIELAPETHGSMRRLRVVPISEGDRGHLVRALALRVSLDDGPLREVDPTTALDAGDPHREVRVRYAVEALGPGGAVLAQSGSDARATTTLLAGEPVDETFLHVALGTVGAVVVAGAISFVIAFLATDGFTVGQPTSISHVDCTGCGARMPLVSF